MSVRVVQNFTWEVTKKKLVVFMPNFNGKALTEFAIQKIQTAVRTDDYMIIIGNDNVLDDWEHLRNQNVGSFTIYHDGPPRNGSFIRNYAIKRCQSEFFFQKDAEVAIEGDFIGQIILNGKGAGWQAGYTVALTPEQTLMYLKTNSCEHVDNFRPTELLFPNYNFEAVKAHLLERNGKQNFTTHFHYAFCVPTSILQGMHGYDEDFRFFGWEDVDMLMRLAAQRVFLIPDYTCYAAHLYHPICVDLSKLDEMRHQFQIKNPEQWLRNPQNWGEGK